MRRSTMVLVLAAAIVSVGVWTRPAAAQDAAKAQSGAVTVPELIKVLTGLGYETTKVNDSTSRIMLERGKWSFKVNVGVSSNNKKVWLTSYVAEIPDIAKVPQPVLAKLLQANLEYGPAHFVVSEGDPKPKKWLKMQYAIDNRNITPVFIREELDYFAAQLQDSAPLWDTTKWVRNVVPSRQRIAALQQARK